MVSELHVSSGAMPAGVNLLLAGFPKCGTTAIAEWLSGCAEIEVSNPKETFLLHNEFPFFHRRALSGSLNDAFVDVKRVAYRCEASVLNVYSDSVLEMVKQSNDVKVILTVRSPVEAFVSWHNQLVNAGLELERDPVKAWQRGQGKEISGFGDDFLLNYAQVCAFGRWLERWVRAVGHERLLMVSQVDLHRSPWEVGARIERFLDVRLPEMQTGERVNSFSKVRFPLLLGLVRGRQVRRLWYFLERRFVALEAVRKYLRYSVLALKTEKKELDSAAVNDIEMLLEDDQRLVWALMEENRRQWPER